MLAISLLLHSSNMMDVKIRAVVLLLSMLEDLVLVRTLENNSVEHQNLHTEKCDLMLVSHAGTTEGKAIFI